MNRRTLLDKQALKAVEAQMMAGGKKLAGDLRWTADDADCPDVMRLAALTEELGEIARAVHDGDTDALRLELSQLAGVALAWGVAVEEALRQTRLPV